MLTIDELDTYATEHGWLCLTKKPWASKNPIFYVTPIGYIVRAEPWGETGSHKDAVESLKIVDRSKTIY